tara:strand:+ start:11769 stop:12317 length:549 start_codon:yes stop_codon:yes gene_type:complete
MVIELKESTGKMLSISQDDKALRLMIPKSSIPFGFTEFVPPNGNPNISLEISLCDDTFIDKIRDIEDEIIHKISEKSQGIFKRHMTPVDIREIFNSNFKNDRLRVKHTRNTRLFNSEGKPTPSDVAGGDNRGWMAAVSVTVSSVYFFNKKVGLVWNADQIKLWEPETTTESATELKGFAFTI